MNLKEILINYDPVKLVLITVSNKDLEKAFHEMILTETGVNLTFKIETDYGIPLIAVTAQEWESLSIEERLQLEKLFYSFDYPDEDLGDLLRHLFKTDEEIEAVKAGMTSETNFEINLYIPLIEYERLLSTK